MNTSPNPSPTAAELRRQAEERLRGLRPETGLTRAEADTHRLMHELQVHQIELEMQNGALQRACAEREALLTKFTALYDFAPVGYFTLDRAGTILGLNLAGARLLGIERSKLSNRRFGPFIAADMRPAFTAFLQQAFDSCTKGVCELPLQQAGDPPRWVWLEACGGASSQECLLAVLDITRRKQAETDHARLERQVHAASEQEQRSIGECLQEDLCQRLAGIQAATTAMAHALSAEARPESSLADDVARQVHESLHQALQLANTLQPGCLLEQGLLAALENLAFHVQERSGIRCHLQGEDLPQLALADANHLYRIAQEAVNTAVQHAKPSQILIALARSQRAFTLTVADDGSREPEQSEPGSDLGSQIMRYRSGLLGAVLTTEPKPGGGTVVTCSYPLPGKRLKHPPSLITAH